MSGVLLAAVAAALVLTAPARSEEAGPGAAAPPSLGGRWTGAKLRCQKEENRLVRCGTPMPFEIAFDDKGTGSTPDENLPREFTWRWSGAKEIVVTPKGTGTEIKLFGVEREDEQTLTFQAYIYLPTTDPNAPAESSYIHFVFDVTRAP